MNVRKPIDYSALFAALDTLIAADLPQMELYRGIGRLVSDRPEKGAAVAAAEHLQDAYPDVTGFSPQNLRRMRDFYRTYESTPEIMAEAMAIGWTQNAVILEADLSLQEKTWYIRAVQQFGWSKLELAGQIASSAHLEKTLDLRSEVCYTEKTVTRHTLPPRRKQAEHGIDCVGKTARQLTNSDYDKYGLLIEVKRANLRNTHHIHGGDFGGKVTPP